MHPAVQIILIAAITLVILAVLDSIDKSEKKK
jgi:hypothetical protein